VTEPTSGLPSLTEDEARAWSKVEDVAIHFNEMILNFRLKALGAITVAAGLVGTVLLNKEGVAAPQMNYFSFALAIWFLAVVWLAIMCLDLGYYHRLLLGAVDEALRIEEASQGRLQLSTKIREKAEKGPGDSLARTAFYILPLIAMILAGCIAWRVAPDGASHSNSGGATVPLRPLPHTEGK
jgi:hypothetical protein